MLACVRPVALLVFVFIVFSGVEFSSSSYDRYETVVEPLLKHVFMTTALMIRG